MITNNQTPGVYVQELDAFGNSVVPVATAVPAFIGYTEKTKRDGKDIVNKAIKVTSLSEFKEIFGGNAPKVQFELTDTSEPEFALGDKGYKLTPTTVQYRLYSAIHFFYQNGGGECYIVSTGSYDYSQSNLTSTTPFENALKELEKEEEPTIIVIPDAVELKDTSQTDLKHIYASCYDLQSQMINHCGSLKNRFTILDIPRGYEESVVGETSIEGFRNNVEGTLSQFNSYAGAYYPWLHTTILQLGEVSCANISPNSHNIITAMLQEEFADKPDAKPYINALFSDDEASQEKAEQVFKNNSPNYKNVMNAVLKKLNLMAPSAAMAGVYTLVDSNEGVWKAPANVGVQSVIEPAIKVDSQLQEDLNVPLDGKSVCAIRSFPGMGVLVWGARTLDGNSNDFRYINVRRTLIFIEESVKEATKAFVFSSNDSSTWDASKRMISNFLNSLWSQGGLVGAKASDAYFVSVGLGSTMTSQDVLDGNMIVSVKVALVHPAEFIEITFQQQMLTS